MPASGRRKASRLEPCTMERGNTLTYFSLSNYLIIHSLVFKLFSIYCSDVAFTTAKQQLNIIQVGSPLNGSCTLVQSLFSGASTRHGLSLSSTRFAMLLSGFRAFVALTEVSQSGLPNKVFGP